MAENDARGPQKVVWLCTACWVLKAAVPPLVGVQTLRVIKPPVLCPVMEGGSLQEAVQL